MRYLIKLLLGVFLVLVLSVANNMWGKLDKRAQYERTMSLILRLGSV